jgi:hypothetical protein
LHRRGYGFDSHIRGYANFGSEHNKKIGIRCDRCTKKFVLTPLMRYW